MDDHPCLRLDRNRAVHHGLRATPGARRAVRRRARHRQGTAGRRVDHVGPSACGRRAGSRRAPRRRHRRRDHGSRQRRDGGVLQRSRRDGGRPARRLFSQRRRRRRPSGRLRRHPRSAEGRHHQRRREYLIGGSGRRAPPPRRGARSGGGRHAGREMGRGAARVRRAEAGRSGDRGRAEGLHPRPSRAFQMPAQFQFRRRSAENRNREDSEIRPARAEVGDRGAVDDEEETAGHVSVIDLCPDHEDTKTRR